MKAVVAAFNQEKALVGAFSVITNLRIELCFKLYWQPIQSTGGMHTSRDKQTINKSYNVHPSLGSGHHWARLARRGTAACTWAGSARLQTNAWLAEFRIFSTMRLVRKATISHYQLPVSHPTNYLGLQPIKRRQASHRAAGYMITPYYAFNFQYLQFGTTIKQIFVQY